MAKKKKKDDKGFLTFLLIGGIVVGVGIAIASKPAKAELECDEDNLCGEGQMCNEGVCVDAPICASIMISGTVNANNGLPISCNLRLADLHNNIFAYFGSGNEGRFALTLNNYRVPMRGLVIIAFDNVNEIGRSDRFDILDCDNKVVNMII